MHYTKLKLDDINQLLPMMQKYKASIGEPPLSGTQFEKLQKAVSKGDIDFFVAQENGHLFGMCSVGIIFSTFTCNSMAVFEDFYITEEYRGKGIARGLTQYVFDEMKKLGVTSVWVGCADVDIAMYESLGFNIRLGNLLTWSAQE